MHVEQYLLAVLALGGHAGIWVGLCNRAQSSGLPSRWMHPVEMVLAVMTVVPVFVWVAAMVLNPSQPLALWQQHPLGIAYLIASWARLLWLVLQWGLVRFQRRQTVLLSNHTRRLDLARELGTEAVDGTIARLAASLPGNEFLKLEVRQKRLCLPDVPPQLTGLKIAHLSDLHVTGSLTPRFYERVVDEVLQLQPDIIALTGDLIDRQACAEWLVPLLGRLRAPLGTYFILGNHDRRIDDVPGFRQGLADAGLVDLGGGRFTRVRFQQTSILVAGDERPWFDGEPPVSGLSEASTSAGGTNLELVDDELLILLAHTPDRIAWARSRGFDLMLAGHTHGGQIRVPGIGAIVSPSRYGTRYAGGVFHEPPTVLHVSRGVAGLQPVRYGCPPEIVQLVLEADVRNKVALSS